mmetsp:Transcript_26010/g.72549  ORF Transcript_26010/g.72549 Transcript_26010/m.72549 type:complete len:285 (-) Transcript_26010:422-1276(-)
MLAQEACNFFQHLQRVRSAINLGFLKELFQQRVNGVRPLINRRASHLLEGMGTTCQHLIRNACNSVMLRSIMGLDLIGTLRELYPNRSGDGLQHPGVERSPILHLCHMPDQRAVLLGQLVLRVVEDDDLCHEVAHLQGLGHHHLRRTGFDVQIVVLAVFGLKRDGDVDPGIAAAIPTDAVGRSSGDVLHGTRPQDAAALERQMAPLAEAFGSSMSDDVEFSSADEAVRIERPRSTEYDGMRSAFEVRYLRPATDIAEVNAPFSTSSCRAVTVVRIAALVAAVTA